MTVGLYRIATRLALPLARYHLGRRLAAGREDPMRIGERMGQPSRSRPEGPLIWLHAASVGESLSLLGVIDRLRREQPRFAQMITTGTVTSSQVLADRLPEDVIHQFMPVDCAPWVRSFLDHWRPDMALWSESELWPAMLSEIRARGITAILLNARMSERSWRRWRRLTWFSRSLLQTFQICLAQSAGDAGRLRDLGARDVSCCGNLKFSAPPPPADPSRLRSLREAIGARPRWLAFSTHPGEEDIVADVHAGLSEDFEDLLTILVPRHPDRGEEIAVRLSERGLRVVRGSRSEALEPDAQILLGDTIGELGVFFRLAEISLVGGSLVPHGGQNLLEPAKLGSAILHGPHMENFAEIRDQLLSAGGSVEVANPVEIIHEVRLLLTDPSLRQTRIEASRHFAESGRDVLDTVFTCLNGPLGGLVADASPSGDEGA